MINSPDIKKDLLENSERGLVIVASFWWIASANPPYNLPAVRGNQSVRGSFFDYWLTDNIRPKAAIENL